MSNFLSKAKALCEYLNDNRQEEFNNDMVHQTWKYQKKFRFETSPRAGHEFWNNEADAFKHAF